MNPAIERLLKDGTFAFQMGLRRGDDAFFQNAADAAPVLAERQRFLTREPWHYAACEPAGEAALAETIELAQQANPTLRASSLLSLGAQWEPDFLLLRADESGAFRLVAGCVCFPSHWALREKMGRPLGAIHAPVPTLNAALGAKIDAFLANLRPETTWERWNWGLAATAERNDHPSRGLIRLTESARLDACWLRAEHQAFRRLPETQSVLFVIRIVLVPLAEIAREPELAGRLAGALRTMPADIAAYKGLARSRERLAGLLESGLARAAGK